MRYNKVKEIVRLLFLYFERNVFNIGLLKSKIFRVWCIAIISGLIVFLASQLYIFFDNANSSIAQTRVVLDSYSCSVFMWTFLVFLFVKILFIKKGGLTSFTIQMPVLNKERNLAVLIFEIAIALIIVSVLSASMVIALIYRDGTVFLERIVCNITYICITSYFVFELFYAILNYFCDWFCLGKIKNIINICTLSLLLICFYIFIVPDVFQDILFTYKDNTGTSRVLLYTLIAEKYNFCSATLLFVLIVFLLVCLRLLIPNKGAESYNQYVKINKRPAKKISFFMSYVKAFIRKSDTLSYFLIAIFIYVIMTIFNIQNAQYIMTILAINGLYAYVQTDEIRYIEMQKQYDALRDYLRLIVSQIFYISIFSIPVIVITTIKEQSFVFVPYFYLTLVFSILFFTLSGILFPAKNENPFSALFGIIFIIVVIFVVLAVCFIFDFTNIETGIYMLIIAIIVSGISVVGLKKLYFNKK